MGIGACACACACACAQHPSPERRSHHEQYDPSRTDVYARVTDRIIADLEAGVRPWLKPWKARHAEGRIALPRRHNGTPYRGINILLLWGAAMAKGYSSSLWMTYRQAGELKAHVGKGEQGSLVVFADRVARRRPTTREKRSSARSSS